MLGWTWRSGFLFVKGMPNQLLIAPSILAGNHAALGESLADAESTAGVQWIHLDIMDGHFVPNLTFGPQTVADLRPRSQLFFDTHLMLDNPHEFIEPFAKAGSQNITIHVEPSYPIAETLAELKKLGVGAGICVNPGTPAAAIEPFLEQIDLVLVMTVQPGFGGQSFREDMLPKIKQIRQWRDTRGLGFRIQVDGGVNLETGRLCAEAGADTFVAGTAFFKAADRAAFAAALQS